MTIFVQFLPKVADGQGTKWHRIIAENFNRLSRVHERYRRQTSDGQTDGRRHNSEHEHMSSRSLKTIKYKTKIEMQCTAMKK